MKEKFKDINFSKPNKKKLKKIDKVITEYEDEGYKLTLRQLYYQLVAKRIIPNNPSEYNKLGTLLRDARMAGIVDWDSIEDRIRKPIIPSRSVDVGEMLRSISINYSSNRQEGQSVYLEVWVEKDALSGILKKITRRYDIGLMVNRGYSSTTALYEASQRYLKQTEEGKDTYILYLGDHDPSGLDMIRDMEERLDIFGVNPEIEHIALTKKQIKKYNPPPNPAKVKDPRAKDYIAKFGKTSWEIDALGPKDLTKIVSSGIETLIDMDLFHQQVESEKEKKEKIKSIAARIEEELS